MQKRWFVLALLLLLVSILPVSAQGGPGTEDFYIRDFGACVNLPDFTEVTEPDDFNTVYTVPGLFAINFAEYLLPLETLPGTTNEIYNAMIALLDTVSASGYVPVTFQHPEYVSAAVEFTLDGQRMFGMIYRNQDDRLFFLFADNVPGFDMLAIGRAIFAANRWCTPLNLPPIVPPTEEPAAPASQWDCNGNLYNCGDFGSCSEVMSYWNACPGDPSRLDGDNDGVPCEALCG